MNVNTVDFEPSLNEDDCQTFCAITTGWRRAKCTISYVDHCGPPRDDLFLMIAYLDAFLADDCAS